MSNKQCPKCGASCKVTEANLELGLPVKCACGCSFEVLPEAVPIYRLNTQPSQTQKAPPPTPSPAEKEKRSVRKSPLPIFVVVVGVAIAYVLWLCDWPKLLFVESVTLTIFCWRQKRNWKKRDNKSLRYFLFDKSVEFFVPLTIVLGFYDPRIDS